MKAIAQAILFAVAVRRFLLLLPILAANSHAAQPQIDCAFPGGNILVDNIEQDTVRPRLRPRPRPRPGPLFAKG